MRIKRATELTQGFYWGRFTQDGRKGEPRVFQVFDNGGQLRIIDDEKDSYELDSSWLVNFEFIGPIPAPDFNSQAATHPSRGVVDERRLIGWRTGDYLHETADQDHARSWIGNVEVLPIFEGDPNTKLQAAALPAVPEGMVLVPERMHLSVEALEALSFHCSGVDPESTDLEERWCSGTLWVGDILDDDGKPTHGLHLSNDECPEEGCVTLVEFAVTPAPEGSGND